MIGVLGFDSRRELGIFLLTTASRTALGPTQPPLQWIPGALSLGVKRPGREADHSPPSSFEVNDAWSYTSTPQYVFMALCLVKHKDNFTFTLPSHRQSESNMRPAKVFDGTLLDFEKHYFVCSSVRNRHSNRFAEKYRISLQF
jgi:hypothetical protein